MKSPKPPKQEKGNLNFSQAIEEVLKGRSITKLEWGDKQYFGILKNEKLMLHKPDSKFYDWVLSEADMRGDDFVII